MKTVVMGAGVVGVASAYYLAKEGHEVTVLERQPEAGCETSYANAGLFAPGHATAWASPQAPMNLVRSLLGQQTALRFKFNPDPRFWMWSLQFLANCTSERQRRNTLPKLKLCLYSQERTREVLEETGIDCDMISKGLLYLHRRQEDLEVGIKNMAFLKENGHKQRVIDRDEVVKIEPALEGVKDHIAGAIYGPDDESGDAHKFTQGLAKYCEDNLGITFRYNTTVKGMSAGNGRVDGVITDKGTVSGDLYVLSLGAYSSGVARSVGVKLPIYPVKGYSVTIPVDGHNGTPTVGGVDEQYLCAWARMGDRFRVTSTAEFTGYDTSFKASDFSAMLGVIKGLFPDAGDWSKPSYWACLRPMTPDGPPIFGKTRHRNLYLCAGPGHMGWTMACGSGKIIADVIAGRKPELDMARMTLDRF